MRVRASPVSCCKTRWGISGNPWAEPAGIPALSRPARWGAMWVARARLAGLMAVTFSAALHKIFDPNPLIGFLAHARQLAAGPATGDLSRRILNDRLDTAVCALLLVLVSVIVIESARQWLTVISGRREAITQETPFVATRYAAEETI